MAEVSYPAATYNSGAVTDAEYQRLPHAPDGLVGRPSESGAEEAVYANSSGREVHIRADRYGAVLGRAWTSGATGLTLPITANSSGSTRFDTVVLRLDRSTWLVRAAARAGTPGAGPPALVRDTGDTGLFEIPLADVTVADGASVIASGDVRMRALYQAGTIRPAKAIADVTGLLAAGDILYEGGRWLGWDGTATRVIADDTGWATLSLNGPQAAAWALNGTNQVRRSGQVVHVRLALRRTGGDLSTSVESKPLVIPAQFRPISSEHVPGVQSRAPIMARVEATGEVAILAMSVPMPDERTALFSGSWMVG